MSPYEIVYALFRHKRAVLAGLLLGVAGAVAVAVLYPPKYRSSARLLVRYVADTVTVDPSVSGQQLVTPGRPSDTLMGTEVDILTSAELIGTVVATVAEDAALKTNGAAGKLTGRYIAENYEVAPFTKFSNTINVHFDGPDPKSAQRVLGLLIDAYLVKHRDVHQDPGAYDFIARQADEMRTRVNDTEDELQRLQGQAGILTLADSRKAALDRMQEVDRAIRETESALAGTRARLRMLTQQLAARPVVTLETNAAAPEAAAPVSADVLDAWTRLQALTKRETQLLMVYTSNSVPVRSLRRQIAELEGVVGKMAPVAGGEEGLTAIAPLTASPRTEDLATDLAGDRAQEAALLAQLEAHRKQLAVVQADVQRMEAAATQIARLQRSKEIYETNYRYFSQRLEQARIDSALNALKVSNIAIVQSPTLADKAERGNQIGLLVRLFLFGTGLGVAWALARELLLDRTLRHPAEIARHLHAPLLAVLPRLGRPERGAAPTGAGLEATRSLDASCELLSQLLRGAVAGRAQTLLVGIAAPHAGAGVTTVAERIATALQRAGVSRVLLAKVNPDGRFEGKMLGEIPVPEEATHALLGDSTTRSVQTTVAERQLVKVAYATPMLVTPNLFAELERDDYDCVLFDLPPPRTSDVAVRLLGRLHGAILVAETARTPRADALACLHQFHQLGCTTYGVVLNKFETPVPAWLPPPAGPAPVLPPPKAAAA